jgi:hypothetical protein
MYLHKGYANYIHISRGYMKHRRLRTTVLDNRLTDGGEVSASGAGRSLPPGRFLVLISVRG